MKKWNIGEWSEVYVLTKLLSEGKVFAADKNLNKIEDIFYAILKIIREEDGGEIIYTRNTAVSVENERGSVLAKIDIPKMSKFSTDILEEIKKTKKVPEDLKIQLFSALKINKPTERTLGKTDIRIIIHDPKTQSDRDLGFSIKSYLGSNPTLFNAGKNTNIIFKVTNLDAEFDIGKANKKKTCEGTLSYILEHGATVKYEDYQEKKFKANLSLIDSKLPEILADMVLLRYKSNLRNIKDLTLSLEKENYQNFDMKSNPNFYNYKIKSFLFDAALGMTASKQWSGEHDATGGYLVVKKDGEVLCFHVYNWTEFKEYLFQETFIDLPSETRHEYGKLLIGDSLFIKLNFQIRFRGITNGSNRA